MLQCMTCLPIVGSNEEERKREALFCDFFGGEIPSFSVTTFGSMVSELTATMRMYVHTFSDRRSNDQC